MLVYLSSARNSTALEGLIKDGKLSYDVFVYDEKQLAGKRGKGLAVCVVCFSYSQTFLTYLSISRASQTI